MNNPENPSFTDIEEAIRNPVYKKNKVSFEFQASNDENHEFKFSLKGSSKDIDFTVDVRIAIERHDKSQKHHYPHLQCEISKIDNEFFHNGVLHITLLVDSSQELLECCLGFTSIIGEILNFFENQLKLDDNSLLEHFFNDKIKEFEMHKNTLFSFIEKSYIEDEISVKIRKSDNFSGLNQNKKIFFMMRLIFENPMLSPLLEVPTYNRFVEIPCIKKYGITSDQAKYRCYAMLKANHEINKYTPEKFLIEYRKNEI